MAEAAAQSNETTITRPYHAENENGVYVDHSGSDQFFLTER